MLSRFGGRLGGVVTFDTHDLNAFNTPILRYVINVTELNRPEFGLGSQGDYFRTLLLILR